jgi:hypothetical protein
MTFDTVVFGSFIKGTGFTDGSLIESGGLRCFIKPTANIGNAPFDTSITYYDQFGVGPKTTLVTTSVAANTPAGAHIEIILNAGDTGIRNLETCSVTGGTAGDAFNLESWNEGIGKYFEPAYKDNPGTPRGDIEAWGESESRRYVSLINRYSNLGEHRDYLIETDVTRITNGCQDLDYTLQTEIVEPSYQNDVNCFGFANGAPYTFMVQSDGTRRLQAECTSSVQWQYMDATNLSLIWRWKWGGSDYVDMGYYKVEYDLAFYRASMNFIHEFRGKDGTIRYTRNTNSGGWVVPTSVYAKCGEDLLHTANHSRDGSFTSYWSHGSNDHAHWITYDLGAVKRIGCARVYRQGSSAIDLRMIIFISNTDATNPNTPIMDDTLPAGLGWQEMYWNEPGLDSVIEARYIRIYFQKSDDGNEVNLEDITEVQFKVYEKITVSTPDLRWDMLMRVGTTAITAGTEYIDIRNIKIYRYKSVGSVELIPWDNLAYLDPQWYDHAESGDLSKLTMIAKYAHLQIGSVDGAGGTQVRTQLKFSDDNSIWTDYTGPDGTNATEYSSGNYKHDPIVMPTGFTGVGKYYGWIIRLASDGRYTPIFKDIGIWLNVWSYYSIFPIEKRDNNWLSPMDPKMHSSQNPAAETHIRGCPRDSDGYHSANPGCPNKGYILTDSSPLHAHLDGAMNDTQVTFVYKEPWPELDIFIAGTTLLIDNEIMWISALNRTTKTVTVIRGYKSGTPNFWPDATAHDDNVIIHIHWNYHPTKVLSTFSEAFARKSDGYPFEIDPVSWPPGYPTGKIISEGQPVLATLNATINGSQTSLVYTNEVEKDNFTKDQMLIVDDELMVITGVDYTTNTVTIIRGYQSGSPYYWPVAAEHLAGAIIHRPNHLTCPLKPVPIPTSWLESIVGQVMSGYARDQNEDIILDGIKIVITSSTTSGVDQMNPVNPITGFYQIFVKNTKYDNRYLLVNKEGKTFDLAYSKYGLPDIIDGTTKVPSPQDMHFWKPDQICGKSVAYVGSLVSY